MLKGKTVVLGITGSIAAYKAADLASKLTQAGARVEVIMTESACRFITPLTLRNITGRPVVTDMWDLSSEYSVEHVALAEAADIIVIAPATANIIAKAANGIADDMLSCTVLASKAPVLIAPAMNVNMWENKITRHNVKLLHKRDFTFTGPGYGRLASGIQGFGRLIDIDEILKAIEQVLGKTQDLSGKRIVVTAGGTQESIDPVRCLTNRSSGKMGYALAEAAKDRGAQVTLISAPTHLHRPADVDTIEISSAEDMLKAMKRATKKADVLIMAAAVADYKPVATSAKKIKRKNTNLTLELEKTTDILAEVKGSLLKIGFAAETEDLVKNATDKLHKKQLDLIVANDISIAESGIGADNNQVVIIGRDGSPEELPLLPKREVAEKILDAVKLLLDSKT